MAQSWAPFPAFVVDAQQQELDCPWIDGGHFSELKIQELKIALQKNLTKISAKIPGFESRTTELNNIILDEFSKKRYEFNALQAEFTALEYDLHCVRTNRETGHNVNGHLERVRHRYMVLYVKMWQMIVAIEALFRTDLINPFLHMAPECNTEPTTYSNQSTSTTSEDKEVNDIMRTFNTTQNCHSGPSALQISQNVSQNAYQVSQALASLTNGVPLTLQRQSESGEWTFCQGTTQE